MADQLPFHYFTYGLLADFSKISYGLYSDWVVLGYAMKGWCPPHTEEDRGTQVVGPCPGPSLGCHRRWPAPKWGAFITMGLGRGPSWPQAMQPPWQPLQVASLRRLSTALTLPSLAIGVMGVEQGWC